MGATKYNKLGKFILILIISFLTFKFPFVLDSEEDVSSDKGKLEVFTEDTPIDITDRATGGNAEASPLLEESELINNSETGSYTSHVIRLILSLIFVVFLAYIVIKLMKKSKLFVVNDDAYLKLVAQLNIEQGKSVKVFTLGDRAYIVGITSNSITKIAEIEDKVLIDAMNLKASEIPKADAPTFSKVFSNFFPTAKPKKTVDEGLFGDEFLKSQQMRIKNMNLNTESENKE